jgi:hypothetical protein
MPGGDRTGPMGQGARTGRGLGYCGANAAAEFNAGAAGRGWGGGGRWGGGFRCRRFWGQGRGGWAPGPYPVVDPEVERRTLQDEAAALRRQMDDIQRRLAAMEGSGSESR